MRILGNGIDRLVVLVPRHQLLINQFPMQLGQMNTQPQPIIEGYRPFEFRVGGDDPAHDGFSGVVDDASGKPANILGRVEKQALPQFGGDMSGVFLQKIHCRDPILLGQQRSEEHTSELQSLMRISYAVFCLKKNKTYNNADLYTLITST